MVTSGDPKISGGRWPRAICYGHMLPSRQPGFRHTTSELSTVAWKGTGLVPSPLHRLHPDFFCSCTQVSMSTFAGLVPSWSFLGFSEAEQRSCWHGLVPISWCPPSWLLACDNCLGAELFFFFFFCRLRVWSQGLYLKPLQQPFLVMSFFQEKVLRTISLGWPLKPRSSLISASWVARIIGVSHQLGAELLHTLLFFLL
jgi:hypothetical protein